ncbi:hypothetical protein [Agrobacterium vitis]|nr:hypothetical protein [Agrobacterium vitis]
MAIEAWDDNRNRFKDKIMQQIESVIEAQSTPYRLHDTAIPQKARR